MTKYNKDIEKLKENGLLSDQSIKTAKELVDKLYKESKEAKKELNDLLSDIDNQKAIHLLKYL